MVDEWHEAQLDAWVKELSEATDEAQRNWIGKTGGKSIKKVVGYLDWLERFQDVIRPEFYLEIGVDTGDSLRLAKSPTTAIGVDPEPKLAGVKFTTDTIIYCMTSDRYFLERPKPHDLVFIDGLHLFEQTLRDFINVEWYGHEGTVVLMHDVLPQAPEQTTRTKLPGAWTGDVWKLIPILQQWRPDLDIQIIPTPPSGLAVITNLNPESNVLHDNFDSIFKDWFNVPWIPKGFPELLTDEPDILREISPR